MARVPRRLMKHAEALTLTPEQQHLLGVIDGELDEEELSFICGESASEIARRLDELCDAGLIAFARGSGEHPIVDEPSAVEPDDHPLAPETRARIDQIIAQLDKLDFYALLGLGRDADKKAIKSAYYRMAPEFHPDKHFGKDLGSYKKRIELVFDRLTKAHDTLSNRARRSEYDQRLGPAKGSPPAPRHSVRPAPAPSIAPSDSGPPPGSSPRPRISSPGIPTPPRLPTSTPPPPTSIPSFHLSDPVPASQPVPSFPRPNLPPSEEVQRARREALRRKLLAGGQVTGTPRPGAQSEPKGYRAPEGAPRSAAELLRERFDKIADEARDRRLRKYLDSAEQAMAARDYRTARAAYLQAVKLAPDDAELRGKADLAAKLAGD